MHDNDNLSPVGVDLRAAILGEVLRQAVVAPGPAKATAILASALKSLGRDEREVGLELHIALAVLVRSGLLLSNTFEGETLSIGSRTTVMPSPRVVTFVSGAYEVAS